jgi:hypothetical protein
VTSGSSEVTNGLTGAKLVVPDIPSGQTKEVVAQKKQVGGPNAVLKYRVTYKLGGTTDGHADFTLTIGAEDPAPELSFTRTVSKSMALKGSSVLITYTLKNLGNVDLDGINITDPCVTTMPDKYKNISTLERGLCLPITVAPFPQHRIRHQLCPSPRPTTHTHTHIHEHHTYAHVCKQERGDRVPVLLVLASLGNEILRVDQCIQ